MGWVTQDPWFFCVQSAYASETSHRAVGPQEGLEELAERSRDRSGTNRQQGPKTPCPCHCSRGVYTTQYHTLFMALNVGGARWTSSPGRYLAGTGRVPGRYLADVCFLPRVHYDCKPVDNSTCHPSRGFSRTAPGRLQHAQHSAHD